MGGCHPEQDFGEYPKNSREQLTAMLSMLEKCPIVRDRTATSVFLEKANSLMYGRLRIVMGRSAVHLHVHPISDPPPR